MSETVEFKDRFIFTNLKTANGVDVRWKKGLLDPGTSYDILVKGRCWDNLTELKKDVEVLQEAVKVIEKINMRS